jgi:hypothetical protein
MISNIGKTIRVRAKSLKEGDSIYYEHYDKKKDKTYSFTNEITKIYELDEKNMSLNYKNGGFGVYNKNRFVDKIV